MLFRPRTPGAACAALFVATFLATPLNAAGADRDARPVYEAESANKQFLLRIKPGRDSETAARKPRALLVARDAESQARETVWERDLENKVGPLHAFVSNDGRYIVTCDEFRLGGAHAAVAVYHTEGDGKRVFKLDELLTPDEVKQHAKREGPAIWWLDDARFRMLDPQPVFVIEMPWEKTIAIQLRELELLPANDSAVQALIESRPLVAESPDGLPAEDIEAVLRQLFEADPMHSDEPNDAIPELDLTRAALEELLPGWLDEALNEIDGPTITDLESALNARVADWLEARGLAYDGAVHLDFDEEPDEPNDIALSLAKREAAADPTLDALHARGNYIVDDFRDFMRGPNTLARGASFPDGDLRSPIRGPDPNAVPSPDVENKVDYVAWANSFTSVEGNSAVPLYHEAMDAYIPPDETIQALFDAAMAGDPNALDDPRLAAYIADNQVALDAYRDARDLPYNGWPLEIGDTPDENFPPLIGVLLPSLGTTRNLARLSTVEARMRERQGDIAGALDLHLDNLAGGAQIGRGVTLIEGLVGVAMQRMGSEGVLETLQRNNDAVDYVALRDRLRAEPPAPIRPLEQTVQFERAMLYDTLQFAYQPNPYGGAPTLDMRAYDMVSSLVTSPAPDSSDQSPMNEIVNEFSKRARLAMTTFDGSLATADRVYGEISAATRAPYGESMDRWESIEQELGSPALYNESPFVATLVPALSRAQQLLTTNVADRRALRLVTEIKAYQQEFGRLPDTLAELPLGDYQVDPFTNAPFAYLPSTEDFTLYSTGVDAVDDGGFDERRLEPGMDIRYWPRPPRD